jgi:hypothetical protein
MYMENSKRPSLLKDKDKFDLEVDKYLHEGKISMALYPYEIVCSEFLEKFLLDFRKTPKFSYIFLEYL